MGSGGVVAVPLRQSAFTGDEHELEVHARQVLGLCPHGRFERCEDSLSVVHTCIRSVCRHPLQTTHKPVECPPTASRPDAFGILSMCKQTFVLAGLAIVLCGCLCVAPLSRSDAGHQESFCSTTENKFMALAYDPILGMRSPHPG